MISVELYNSPDSTKAIDKGLSRSEVKSVLGHLKHLKYAWEIDKGRSRSLGNGLWVIPPLKTKKRKLPWLQVIVAQIQHNLYVLHIFRAESRENLRKEEIAIAKERRDELKNLYKKTI